MVTSQTQTQDISSLKMNSLNFYLKSAERAIARWGYPYMLKDEDCIADVAHAMMKADMNFNGKGSRYGYRGKCAKWAILYTMIDNGASSLQPFYQEYPG